MIQNIKNMSKTLKSLPHSYPLQLDYFQCRQMEQKNWHGVAHSKNMPFSLLLQPLEGQYVVDCQGEEICLNPGQVGFIPADTDVTLVHMNGKSGSFISHWIHFRFSYYRMYDFLSLYEIPLKLPEQVNRKSKRLIQQGLTLQSTGDDYPLKRIREYVISSSLLEMICGFSESNPLALATAGQERFRSLLKSIYDRPEQSVSVAEMAVRAGYSESRFHALFQKEYGCSPMRYVMKVRLEAAARLLAGSEIRMTEVAEQTGFTDAFHFSHAFKKQYGMSPRAYRKQAEPF
jgi:AraC-like DNA-binding protein